MKRTMQFYCQGCQTIREFQHEDVTDSDGYTIGCRWVCLTCGGDDRGPGITMADLPPVQMDTHGRVVMWCPKCMRQWLLAESDTYVQQRLTFTLDVLQGMVISVQELSIGTIVFQMTGAPQGTEVYVGIEASESVDGPWHSIDDYCVGRSQCSSIWLFDDHPRSVMFVMPHKYLRTVVRGDKPEEGNVKATYIGIWYKHE